MDMDKREQNSSTILIRVYLCSSVVSFSPAKERSMVYVELRFPVLGDALPRDYGRAIFRAISRVIPEAASAGWLLVKDMQGIRRSNCSLDFLPKARLGMRLPQSRVSLMLKLSGKRIAVGRCPVRFGTPEISLLEPSSSLYAKRVTINGCSTPRAFLDALAWRLDEMGIECEIELGLRHRFRAGGRVITGYGLTLHDLNEEDSIALQEQGLGNHRHLGCGYFVAVRKSLNQQVENRRLY
jgi:CRISPR-associated protein Cas6